MKPPIKNLKLLAHPKGHVTQFFGENPALYRRFGLSFHNGIDIVSPHGTPLYAIEDGEVVSVLDESTRGFGRHIRILSDATDENGLFREWVYAHNSAHHVKVGDKVKAGQHIADMGNTGFVVSGNTPFWKSNPHAGTHLHLGLRMVKRVARGFSYPGSTVKISVQNHNNGVRGAIDPMPIIARIDNKPPVDLLLHKLSLLQRLKSLMKK